MEVGVSQPVGFRWFRTAGGMAPSHLSRSAKPLSGRYLSFAEREEIALLQAQGLGVREVACRLGRTASAISRELRRNAATRGNALDNAPMESSFHTPKTELVHHRAYATHDEARRDLFAYVEVFYNRKRLHSGLGYKTPDEAERRAQSVA